MKIELMQDDHADAVLAIYQHGINSGNATFETALKPWNVWIKGKIRDACFVACIGGEVAGWVTLMPTSERYCYRGVVEESVYVHPGFTRQGVGDALLGALVECSEELEYWTLVGAIFPENMASIKLHERHGFRVVGTRKCVGFSEIGPYRGWRDVCWMERRSSLIT